MVAGSGKERGELGHSEGDMLVVARSKKERHKGGKGRSLREKRRSLVGKRCKAEGDRTKMVHKLISLENRLEDSPEQAQQADG